MAEYLDLDGEVKAVTKELKERADAGAEWMGKTLDDEKVGNRGDHYEGDFKKRGVMDCGCVGGTEVEGHVH